MKNFILLFFIGVVCAGRDDDKLPLLPNDSLQNSTNNYASTYTVPGKIGAGLESSYNYGTNTGLTKEQMMNFNGENSSPVSNNYRNNKPNASRDNKSDVSGVILLDSNQNSPSSTDTYNLAIYNDSPDSTYRLVACQIWEHIFRMEKSPVRRFKGYYLEKEKYRNEVISSIKSTIKEFYNHLNEESQERLTNHTIKFANARFYEFEQMLSQYQENADEYQVVPNGFHNQDSEAKNSSCPCPCCVIQ